MKFEERDYTRGRKLLGSLLPWAKAEARKRDMNHETESALGKATATHVTFDNLDALMIYPAPLGGWHADIVMKRTPPGVPNVLGSPVAQPHRTRQEAEEAGKRLLAVMCAMAEKNAANPAKAGPVFLLYDSTVDLVPEVYQIALAICPEMARGYSSKQQAIQRLETLMAELFPGGYSAAAANALPTEEMAHLLSVLHIAALTGVYAYPPSTDASPSGHREAETKH